MGIVDNALIGASGQRGYFLTRSLRFRASASAYLNRTPSVAGNRQTWTYSVWAKLGAAVGTSNYNILMARTSASYYTGIYFNANNLYLDWYNSTQIALVRSSQVFRDPSAWYHIVIAVNTTSATSSNRILMYVNGTQVTAFTTATYPPQNAQTAGINEASIATWISSDPAYPAQGYYDGYLAEINFIDGQALTPSSFGSTNALTGVWQPARYTGTYGTNGFYLPFTDNSALTTSSNVGLGKDFSGNGNYWTTNNISITAGVTYDSMTDVPTLTSATAANFAVLNPVAPLTQGLTNGNLNMTGTATVYSSGRSTIAIPAGTKIYWECAATAWAGGSSFQIGMVPTTYAGGNSGANYVGMQGAGNTFNMGSISSIGTFALNNVMGLAYDQAAGTLAIYKNNTLLGTISSVSTTLSFMPRLDCYTTTESGWINFGQRPFTYTPPTGFVALNTFNLPTSTIVKGNTVMDATIYTGTGAIQSIVNAGGFKPDLLWIKNRVRTSFHDLVDSVRGVANGLSSNDTRAELTPSLVTSLNSNGFTLPANTTADSFFTNLSGEATVGWQWQAGQGSSSSNTNGTITSTVSVNASAGFSVVTYTGTGANATVGHGLGVAPSWIVVKQRNGTVTWRVYHASLANTQVLYLSATDAATTETTTWNSTTPTSTVFSVGTGSGANGNTNTYVAYCWTPIAGFSAFGSYTGNGSTDGPFIYLGFRPKYILWKRTDTTGDWGVIDTARDPYNIVGNDLTPNASSAEGSGYTVDFLSNGFKIRLTATRINASGGTYIYMAFAENPLKNALAR
jgi:hypothetical protein